MESVTLGDPTGKEPAASAASDIRNQGRPKIQQVPFIAGTYYAVTGTINADVVWAGCCSYMAVRRRK